METNQSIARLVDISTPVTKIPDLGCWTEKSHDKAARFRVMLEDVPATVKRCLAGAIGQWYIKPDSGGGVFIMNVTSTETAHQLAKKLSLGMAGMMAYDLIEFGPIIPKRLLLP